MPPKIKYTKEDIVKAAYEIMDEKGIDYVVTREIAKKLGSTTAPIFTSFSNVNELYDEVYKMACDNCEEYLNESINYKPALKEFGLRLIRFAKKHPHSYKLIFMSHGVKKRSKNLLNINFIDIVDDLIKEVIEQFDISETQAKYLVNSLCVQAQGIASLIVDGTRKIDEDVISEMLSTMCISLVAGFKLKSGEIKNKKYKQMLDMANRYPVHK